MIWLAILIGSVGTYLLKLAGFVVPTAVLDRPMVRRVSGLLPISMLAALVVVQTFSVGSAIAIDARLAGLAVAIVALIFRAPFLVVVLLAAVTAGVLRAVGLAS